MYYKMFALSVSHNSISNKADSSTTFPENNSSPSWDASVLAFEQKQYTIGLNKIILPRLQQV